MAMESLHHVGLPLARPVGDHVAVRKPVTRIEGMVQEKGPRSAGLVAEPPHTHLGIRRAFTAKHLVAGRVHMRYGGAVPEDETAVEGHAAIDAAAGLERARRQALEGQTRGFGDPVDAPGVIGLVAAERFSTWPSASSALGPLSPNLASRPSSSLVNSACRKVES